MNITKAGTTLVLSDATPEEQERIIAFAKQGDANRPPKMLTRTEAAKIIGVHPGSLKRWAAQKILVPVKVTARVLRYRESDVLALIEKRSAA